MEDPLVFKIATTALSLIAILSVLGFFVTVVLLIATTSFRDVLFGSAITAAFVFLYQLIWGAYEIRQ